MIREAVDELGDGWEDNREEAYWTDRPDDGRRYVKAEGLWVPV